MLKKLSVFICLVTALSCTAMAGDVRYPREISNPQGRIIVHAPQIKNWMGFELLNGVTAIEVTLPDMDKAAFGTVEFSGNTITELEQHTVTFYSLQINTVKFSGADKAKAVELEKFVRSAMDRTKLTLPLEVMLQYLDEGILPEEGPKGLSNKPPVIFYATTDSRLLMLDGKPILAPITQTDLQFVVNTNWDLFYVDSRATWYLRDNKRWYSMAGSELKGEGQTWQSFPKPSINYRPRLTGRQCVKPYLP